MSNIYYHPCRAEHIAALEIGGYVRDKDFAVYILSELADGSDEECVIEIATEKLEKAKESMAKYEGLLNCYSSLADLQKVEALKRLEILERFGLHPNVVSEFRCDGTVNYSDRARLGVAAVGVLYWVENSPSYLDAIARFEQRKNVLVYHATHETVEFGELMDMFYVSGSIEGWLMDRRDLAKKNPCVYVVNFSCPDFSEFGLICFDVAGGGLIRTA